MKGLMFAPPLKKNQSVLLKFNKEKNIPIHMFFVFFPIDALWIDSNYKIVYIQRDIKPFTSHIDPKTSAIAVLETAQNQTKNLRIGDKLSANNL